MQRLVLSALCEEEVAVMQVQQYMERAYMALIAVNAKQTIADKLRCILDCKGHLLAALKGALYLLALMSSTLHFCRIARQSCVGRRTAAGADPMHNERESSSSAGKQS